MHSFTKIALQKVAVDAGEQALLNQIVENYENTGHSGIQESPWYYPAAEEGKGLLSSTGDWLKERYHAIKDAFLDGGKNVEQLVKDHPTGAIGVVAAAKAGTLGAGLLGLRALKRARSTANRAVGGLEEASSKIKALKGANKKLGLMAAIGIPGSAAATYFATRDSGKKKRK